MDRNIQVRFDDRKRQLTVTFIINDARKRMTLSYAQLRNCEIAGMQGHRAHKLSYKEFKLVAKSMEERFVPDMSSGRSVEDQFVEVMAKVADVLHPRRGTVLTTSQIQGLGLDIRMIHESFLKAAGIASKEFSQAMTAGYCEGVDTLFQTQDFIAIRKGNTIVARINLEGNDYNELREFLKHGGDRVLTMENIEQLQQAVKRMKMDAAIELATPRPDVRKGKGLSPWEEQ